MNSPGYRNRMSIRTILSIAVTLAFASLPATALADLHVDAAGFHRVVTDVSQGDACRVHRTDDGTTIRCPDGSKGTMTLYRNRGEDAACELDFWTQANSKGNGNHWRAQLSHQNSANGTCTLHWNGMDSLQITIS